MIIDENAICLAKSLKKICDLVNYVSNLCYVCGDKIL